MKAKIINNVIVIDFGTKGFKKGYLKEFLNAISKILKTHDNHLLLDLSQVDSLDDYGLNGLLKTMQLMAKLRRDKITLCCVSDKAKTFIGTKGMAARFTFAGSRDNAFQIISKHDNQNNPLKKDNDCPEHTQGTNNKENPKKKGGIIVDDSFFREIISPDKQMKYDVIQSDDSFFLENQDILKQSPVKKTKQPNDKRKSKRVGENQIIEDGVPISCVNTFTKKESKGMLVNVSKGGLCMESDEAHEIGDRLQVKFVIGRVFTIKEKCVIRSYEERQYGLEFVNISSKAQSDILRVTGY